MTNEQQALLQILQCHMQGVPFREAPADWLMLLREAWVQSVILPLFDVIQPLQAQIPQPVYQVADKQTRKLSVNNMQISYAQQRLVSCLEQAGIDYVILKGEASAAYYPKPELRQLGDVDFIVPASSREAALLQLQASGFTLSGEENDHHIGLKLGKVSLELHSRLAGVPQGEKGQLVERYMADLYSRRKTAVTDYGSFSVPAEEHQAVILLLHMQHHLVSQGMGLRHIMDWVCFVNKTWDAPFWQEKTLPLLRELGLLRFAAAITKSASDWLGSRCPDWAQQIPQPLSQALMEDILAGGNFGRKDAQRSRSGNMLPSWEHQDRKEGRVKMLYKTLKRAAEQTHPKLKNKPIRLHLAMTGKAFRYMGLRLVGKRPSLLKAATHADTRKSLYEQLELYE